MTVDWTAWLLNSAVASDGSPVAALVQRSLQHRRAGDMEQAVNSARAAHRLAGTDPEWLPVVQHLLGSLRKAMGDHRGAIELYESALQGMTESFGEQAPQTEIVLRALADAHHKIGHFDTAHDYCLRALAMTREARDVRYALGCHLLARIRSSIGDYAGAEAANQEANEILAKAKGATPDAMLLYAANISQGAVYRVRRGDLGAGVAQQRKALKLRRRHLPPDDPAVAESLTHLANAELAAGHPRRARRLLRKVLAMHERMGEHADKARHINDRIAHNHVGFLLGRRTAESAAAVILADAREHLGEHHPITIDALLHVAEVQVAAGRPRQALELVCAAVAGENLRIGPVFATRSDQERLAFVATLYQARDLALSALVADPGVPADRVLQIVAQRSGLTLDAVVHRHQAVLSGRYPELVGDVQRLREIDESLAGIAFGATPPSFRTVRDWEQERDRLQTGLVGRIPELRREHDLVTATVERLAEALPADSTLLQYVRFAYSEDRRAGRPRAWYGAFLLTAGQPGSVRFVDLGPADELDRMIGEYRRAIAPATGRSIRVRPTAAGTDWRPLAAKMHRAIIEPLRLPTAARLVVVPDGDLHKIPLASLVGPEGRPMVADAVITHLGSARDLLLDRRPAPAGPALVIASPDYGDHDSRQRRAAVFAVFRPLDGSLEEGEEIAKRLGTTALTGSEATKSALRTTPAPAIIHLATHGFFLGGAVGSGLAFAGANSPGDQGILTAAEIAHLNLTGTNLVVLSACDSGLGTIQDAEGVLGLCRAFTIAGARTVVSSLWSIPDRPTARLMLSFYENLKDPVNLGDPAIALARTQATLAAGNRHVREWGAFACHGLGANR
ncbi:CHAT domain-containing protein [Asanoa hainanensis]|uniref:CHAT domain-containing protein n=1 Tax=Asanoa hainanensis TaxID=560556 RepID=A0A239PGP3_9ACTN|nr:CHAT domain-containing protein [Asanoa hainanensis]SNT66241.1 CHAT domain-containing protein [Asanoa hainanensis]